MPADAMTLFSRKELQEQWVASSHALATALCSVAEIYLTDSCDEANAEQKCEMLATEAVGLVQGLAEQARSLHPCGSGAEIDDGRGGWTGRAEGQPREGRGPPPSHPSPPEGASVQWVRSYQKQSQGNFTRYIVFPLTEVQSS